MPRAVPTARRALTDFAFAVGAQGERLQAVRLATSEAVTNVVMHAYEAGETGEVHVGASCIDGELWVLVADRGQGLRPRDDRPGLGLGLALIARLADDLAIFSRGSGGTELRMRFDLWPGRADSPVIGERSGTSSFTARSV